MKFSMEAPRNGGAGTWSVDPDGVAGVLSLVDAEGPSLDSAGDAVRALAESGVSTLTAGGRSVMARAWERFLEERQNVPGKLLHLTHERACRVGQASTDLLTGDVVMSETTAREEWGIADAYDYMYRSR